MQDLKFWPSPAINLGGKNLDQIQRLNSLPVQGLKQTFLSLTRYEILTPLDAFFFSQCEKYMHIYRNFMFKVYYT